MYKFLVIFLAVFLCFCLENVFLTFFSPFFTPNLLILLIVFVNLTRGIRYAIVTALIAGLFKDSYSAGAFGMHIFSFLLCAYFMTFLKINIYQAGSMPSRMLLVFLIDVIYIGVYYLLSQMFYQLEFSGVFLHVLLPEVLATTLLTPFVFGKFKLCVSRFSV